MEFLAEYGMFLAKVATIVVALVIVIGVAAASGQRSKKPGKKGSLKVSFLNDHFEEMKDSIRSAVLDKDALKSVHKEEKKKNKAEQKERKAALKKAESEEESTDKKRTYVLNFKGNIAADAVACLREEISAVLSMATADDEVLLRLESPGGMVHAYGLASSQLVRLKNARIPLTICVDKVAASGGYMMACLADKLVAAPFSIIGSIGVLVQLPNFHRVLKKYDVDYEIISAGEYKRTLTTFGEITQKGRDKVQEDVETIHDLFKGWVKDHRPSVEIDKISTGETWVGTQAKERYMVDELKTSDECILNACEERDVYEVEYEFRKSIQDRLGRVLEQGIDRAMSRWFERSNIDTYQ
ncbi:MAG: protease SohB [Pseudomonadales bacterium]|nr:protease SohB [Pseudomonadales bacterium]